MSQNVTVTKHIAAVGIGMSGAQIFADDAGVQYFVKYKENGQNLRILANEYVAAQIAQRYQLPCPESFIVTIDSLLISSLPQINGQPISAGPHFATKKVENLYSGPALRSLISKCSNTNQYPGIILFDALLYNTDRRNDGNYLILTSGSQYQFCIIDHGHCFGMNWTPPLLTNYLPLWSGAYLDEMYSVINARTNFDPGLQKISQMGNDFISNLVDDIPPEWQLNAGDSAALKDYLSQKRDNIETLLDNNKDKFPNWI